MRFLALVVVVLLSGCTKAPVDTPLDLEPATLEPERWHLLDEMVALDCTMTSVQFLVDKEDLLPFLPAGWMPLDASDSMNIVPSQADKGLVEAMATICQTGPDGVDLSEARLSIAVQAPPVVLPGGGAFNYFVVAEWAEHARMTAALDTMHAEWIDPSGMSASIVSYAGQEAQAVGSASGTPSSMEWTGAIAETQTFSDARVRYWHVGDMALGVVEHARNTDILLGQISECSLDTELDSVLGASCREVPSVLAAAQDFGFEIRALVRPL